jgi:hypothetical protein
MINLRKSLPLLFAALSLLAFAVPAAQASEPAVWAVEGEEIGESPVTIESEGGLTFSSDYSSISCAVTSTADIWNASGQGDGTVKGFNFNVKSCFLQGELYSGGCEIGEAFTDATPNEERVTMDTGREGEVFSVSAGDFAALFRFRTWCGVGQIGVNGSLNASFNNGTSCFEFQKAAGLIWGESPAYVDGEYCITSPEGVTLL